MCIDRDRAFRLLHPRKHIPVLQPDVSGVICPLVDGHTGAPFLISTKKMRRALAGKQRQILCTCRCDGRENAFFARIEELVGLDPQRGEYVILSPMVHVLGTTHGEPLMAPVPAASRPMHPFRPLTPPSAAARRPVPGLPVFGGSSAP